MEDQSKAQWPKEMTAGNFMLPKEGWYIFDENQEMIVDVKFGDGKEVYRLKQICALPKMVALLVLISGNDTWSREEIMHKAKSICREIGEIE